MLEIIFEILIAVTMVLLPISTVLGLFAFSVICVEIVRSVLSED